jgi:hypothetical protein
MDRLEQVSEYPVHCVQEDRELQMDRLEQVSEYIVYKRTGSCRWTGWNRSVSQLCTRGPGAEEEAVDGQAGTGQ